MKKFAKILLKYGIVYISMIAIFLILLTLVSLIPNNMIEENVRETSEILSEQTNAYLVKVRKWWLMFDNFTDALMVNTAYSIDSKDAFYSVMVARKNYIPGVTKVTYEDTTGRLKFASKYQQLDQVRRIKRYTK